MTENIGGGRLLRVCDLCGGVDDHPRHVLAGGISAPTYAPPTEEIIARVIETSPPDQRNRLLRELMDLSSSDRHMDCCREAGCPDGSCNVVTAGAEQLRGDELLAHLTKEA
jgi:hypothetical protein